MAVQADWRKRIRIGLVVVLIGFFLFCVVSWYVAGSLIAPANRTVGSPPDDLPVESYTIVSRSGSSLALWYLPNPVSSATILLFHPIRGDRTTMLERARLFHEAGFAVVLVDFQAHGESMGRNITVGFHEKYDVRATIEFARGKNPNHKIGVVGYSLGGAATLLAAPIEIDALVLESVYPTISEAVYNRIEIQAGPLKYILAPALLCQIKPRLGFDASDLRPVDFVADLNCPVLFAAGDRDRHTTVKETKRMFELAVEPKQLVVFEGAQHEDLLKFNRPKYESEILGFLTSILDDTL